VPQLVVGADYELWCRVVNVGDVALDPGRRAGALASNARLIDLVAPVIVMNRLRFTGALPATAFRP
jgi:hypothetical protein